MIPYRWPVETVLPDMPEVRREILEAARIVAHENETVRRRRQEIARIRGELTALRENVVGLGPYLRSLVLFELRKYGYNPAEPRIPKHHTGGGQWTEDGVQIAASAADDATRILRSRGGHHFVPKAVYRRLPLAPETKKIFDDARTGSLRGGRHGWDLGHDAYQAVYEALENFLKEKAIQPEDMTPEQAQEFVFQVIGSHDARIRDLNLKLYRREILHYILHDIPLIGLPEVRGGSGGDE
jgi:hypothetical protein